METLTVEREQHLLGECAHAQHGSVLERKLGRSLVELKVELDAVRAELVKAWMELAAFYLDRDDLARCAELRAHASLVTSRIGP